MSIAYQHSSALFVVCSITWYLDSESYFNHIQLMQISFSATQPRQNDLLGIDDGQLDEAVQWQVKVKVGTTLHLNGTGDLNWIPSFWNLVIDTQKYW